MFTSSLLLAAGELYLYAGAIAIFAALIFFSFVILLIKQYKRCPSNRVLVIFGRTGKGTFDRHTHTSTLQAANARSGPPPARTDTSAMRP